MNHPSSNSQQIVNSSRSNFASSFFFLPAQKRKALNAIYAYCRLTDDIVDRDSSTSSRSILNDLAEWRSEVSSALNGASKIPALRELNEAVREFNIPRDCLFQLIDGVSMDINKKTYLNFEELYPYCYKVASIVGLMCLRVFG